MKHHKECAKSNLYNYKRSIVTKHGFKMLLNKSYYKNFKHIFYEEFRYKTRSIISCTIPDFDPISLNLLGIQSLADHKIMSLLKTIAFLHESLLFPTVFDVQFCHLSVHFYVQCSFLCQSPMMAVSFIRFCNYYDLQILRLLVENQTMIKFGDFRINYKIVATH